MLQRLLRQLQGALDGLEHLAPSWMQDDTVKVAQHKTMSSEKTIQGRAELVSRASRDVGAQNHSEPVVLDRPAHHVFGLAPHVLTRGENAGQRPRGIPS